MVKTIFRKDIKNVLMQPDSRGVKEAYYLILAKHQTIFVVSAGLNGSEFNKTAGFISQTQGIQIYQCLNGQGLMLLQRNDEEGKAKEFKVMTLNQGKQVELPTGWAISLINIGKNFLVVVANINVDNSEFTTKPIEEKQGLVYYVLEKKGEIAFEQNSNYSVYPQITTE
ncbi:hypothetical protein HYS94_01470 [Candidatus Daviesbacteria bacterium]|nr:hypothetical protein [Candidatus Daviesbacteria bacterium]